MSAEKTNEMEKICIPGMRLSPSNKDFVPGLGTYVLHGYIYSAVAGLLRKDVDEVTEVTQISVVSPKTPTILPKDGDIVTAKVTVVYPRYVQCVIISVGSSILSRTYRGVIKKEEIRSTDRDRVDPYKCFRSGDVILAKVLPMTEFHWYHLNTAENDLGVVIATAERAPQGVHMIPIGWNEMQCPQTLAKEPRKVAKVLPADLHLKKTVMGEFYKDDISLGTVMKTQKNVKVLVEK